jgi:hypothetical protein
VWSVVGFTILVTGVSVTASLLFLVIGVLVGIGCAYVVRWTTWVDRRLAHGSAMSGCRPCTVGLPLAGSRRT